MHMLMPIDELKLPDNFVPSKFQWTDQMTCELRELMDKNSQSTTSELVDMLASWLTGAIAKQLLEQCLTRATNSPCYTVALEKLKTMKPLSGVMLTSNPDTTKSWVEPRFQESWLGDIHVEPMRYGTPEFVLSKNSRHLFQSQPVL